MKYKLLTVTLVALVTWVGAAYADTRPGLTVAEQKTQSSRVRLL